eukprot:gnl/MRDRNA2_/MRDRNA2_69107_c0_seq1.p1 gnl/MRDRNA2_/MRDRNA2_69107_c0~~gnl/MRDRNA2_/MRDRNA2_69107_c0_seq1.p1  ORF type:complete len:220 (+),score=56.74 gnl/MRDRNA2_/MRDRNA2_69107_c0_seq1:29-661(+)
MQDHNPAGDTVIFNTLLDGCCRHRRFDFADKLIANMQSYNITPSNFTLTILVKMWGQSKQLDKAFAVIEDMPKKYGFQANCMVFTCLITSCVINHQVDKAMQVFEKMKQSSNNRPDHRAYSNLVSGLCKQGKWEKAVELVNDAFGLAGEPAALQDKPIDTNALEQLVKLLAEQGRSESVAVPLLERMRAAKVPISSVFYTIALQRAVHRN